MDRDLDSGCGWIIISVFLGLIVGAFWIGCDKVVDKTLEKTRQIGPKFEVRRGLYTIEWEGKKLDNICPVHNYSQTCVFIYNRQVYGYWADGDRDCFDSDGYAVEVCGTFRISRTPQ